MKLADRLNLSSVNMAIKLNFNDLLKRINALIVRTKDVEDLIEDGVVTSFNGRTGAVLPKSTDYSSDYVSTVAGRRGDVVLVMADITDDLPMSRVTGTLPLSQGGTNADLSATGGTSQVLKQTSVGGNVTVGTLASTDLSDTTSIVYQGGHFADALFEGNEPEWTDTANAIYTKCYLRAKAAGAGDVYGVFVPHKFLLSGSISWTKSTVGSASTTNCSIVTSDCDQYGIKFEISSTAAGDCYAEVTYAVRPNAA